MIKFFRRIRKQLLTENKFSKYLIYAIGEILLVVIGILIALQINNWNEKRKDSNLELEILTGIKNDLEANIDLFEMRISNDSLVVAYFDKLIQILNDETSVYDKSMNRYFGGIESWIPIHTNRMAYSNLQSKGLHLISNDSLRSQIVNLFDMTYILQEDGEKMILEIFSNGMNVIQKYLETGDNVFRKKPNDFRALKEEAEFKNYLTHTRAIRKQLMLVLETNIKFLTIELRDQINEEIKRLEKEK